MGKLLKKIIANWPISFGPDDDDRIEPGAELVVGEDISEDDATAMLNCGACSELKASNIDAGAGNVTPLHPEKTQPPTDADERKAAIVETISLLDKDNKEHFTNDGKPDARVLSELLGWTVSAQERDAVWGETE